MKKKKNNFEPLVLVDTWRSEEWLIVITNAWKQINLVGKTSRKVLEINKRGSEEWGKKTATINCSWIPNSKLDYNQRRWR